MDLYITVEAEDFSQDIFVECRYEGPPSSRVLSQVEELILDELESRDQFLQVDFEDFFDGAWDGDFGSELKELADSILFSVHMDEFGDLPRARVHLIFTNPPRIGEGSKAHRIVEGIVRRVKRDPLRWTVSDLMDFIEDSLEDADIRWVDVTYYVSPKMRTSHLIPEIVSRIPKKLLT